MNGLGIRLSLPAVLLTAVAFLSGCGVTRQPVPPGVIPEQVSVYEADEQYGHEVMNQLTQSYPVHRDDNDILRVRDIVDRLVKAAHADHNPWHVYVLSGDDVKNAAATRGNYIFVWTGMLRAAQNDGELATILAHEIGHVLAGHTAEDPTEETQRIISGIAGMAAGGVLSSRGLGGPVADLAELIVRASLEALLVNPNAQAEELEADQIGLFMMADAGYNPDQALAFWDRVQGDPNFGSSPLEFMSSHPSSSERLANLRGMQAQAAARYQMAKSGTPYQQPLQNSGASAPPAPPRSTAPLRPVRGGSEVWIVQERDVAVHSNPDNSSAVVERLAFNAHVNVRRIHGRWLEISEPVSGYVRSTQLAPQD